MNPERKTLLIQIGLFLTTIITTALAGAEWMFGRSFLDSSADMGWPQFLRGFEFCIPFLGFLTVHEFGHFFAARSRKVKVTLPYYIPLWLGFITSIGTAGAFIKIKEKITSRVDYFDIGVAGPLAGFVVAMFTLWFGFTHLPLIDYIYEIHPEYAQYGYEYGKYAYGDEVSTLAIRLGDSVIFNFMQDTFANPELLPHPNETTHYPLIFAGYLGLFFTALNLLPIGQLDGGHILFSLIGGKNFNVVSPILFTCLVTYAGLGFFTYEEFQLVRGDESADQYMFYFKFLAYGYFMYLCFSRIFETPQKNSILALSIIALQLGLSCILPSFVGYSGFLAFSFLLGRVLGVYHPPVTNESPLNLTRTIIGWLSLLIFIGCFSLQPLG